MAYENLCPGCMGEKGDALQCPLCGWQEGTLPYSPAQLLPRTILQGKYMLGRVLGQGGFGITYLAWDLSLSRKLAIKEYFPREICSRGRDSTTLQPISQKSRSDFDYGLERFKEEGQNLAHFRDYPGIVSLLDYFEANGTAYIVMAYMEGMTFKQYLEEQGGKIDFVSTLAILTPVMDALREVHREGMLHRDISPDNIYINRDRQVKILDFGATRYAMRDQTQGVTVLFKPGYAPFEQYSRNGKQGTWTDVYAVGATFYRALTGSPPPDAPERINRDSLILPSAMHIKIPAKSESALFKALAVQRENRFQRMEVFQEAITPKGIEPPPPSTNLKWIIATCVLLVTTLIFAGLWYSRRPVPTPVAVPEQDTQLRTQLRLTQEKLDTLTRESQAFKGNLSDSAKSLAAVMVERDALQKTNQQLSQNLTNAQNQVNSLQRQLNQAGHVAPANPNVAPALSVAYLQLFEWDRLSNAKSGPSVVFQAARTRRILCALGGPNPNQGRGPFEGQISVEFIAPVGGVKTRVGLSVHANRDQPTWAAMAYWGNDQAGTIEKGGWRVEVSSGSQVLMVQKFSVD